MALKFTPPNIDRAPTKEEAFSSGLSPAIAQMPSLMLQYENLKRQRQQEKFAAASDRVKQQLELLNLGRGQTVMDAKGNSTTVPGITGYEVALDHEGLPVLRQKEGVTPTAGTAGIKLQPPAPLPKTPTASQTTALTPEEDSALVRALRRDTNPLPLSVIKARGPGARALAQALMQDPEYNPTSAEIQFATGKQGASAESTARGHALGTIEPMANSLEDILDYIKPLIASMDPSKIQIVNEAYRKGLVNVNDPDANKLLTHMNEATAMYASVLKGGAASPTDQQFQDAKAIFRGGLSAQGFEGVADAVSKAARSRITRLKERGGGDARVEGPTPETKGNALHSAALDWANANPNDPRAAAVKAKALQELGVK